MNSFKSFKINPKSSLSRSVPININLCLDSVAEEILGRDNEGKDVLRTGHILTEEYFLECSIGFAQL